MTLPGQHPFFAMMADYHTRLHPFPFIAFGLGFAVLMMFFSSHPKNRTISLLILAFLWAWNGLVLFTYQAAKLSPVIYAVQGILFPIQAMLLGHAACTGTLPNFSINSGGSGKAGLAIMFTALFLYPIVGNVTGHSFPSAPVFPEPCPLTIFTFGYLLSADARVRPVLVLIPFLWSLMGIVAVMKLGVAADTIEVIAGIVCSAVILKKNHKPSNVVRD